MRLEAKSRAAGRISAIRFFKYKFEIHSSKYETLTKNIMF
jgi:hypothetical protein